MTKETLIEMVKFRTAASGKVSVKDEFGNETKKDACIFSDDQIKLALELSLRAFNMIPCVTYFKWDDVENIDMISDLLVTYSAYILFSRSAILERGREFHVQDNGVGFSPPPVSDMALALAKESYESWYSQVSDLKESNSFFLDFVQEPDESEDQ